MIGYIVVLATWSILMIVLGMVIRRKDNDSYIEQLKNNADFHKAQKEQFVESTRKIVEANKSLEERNAQLINENKRLKKELDKQRHVTYNYYINKGK